MADGNDDGKPLRVEFAPGVLEMLEATMTPTELQEFMDGFKAMIDSGRIFEESTPVNFEELERDDPEAYEALIAAMSSLGLEDGEVVDIDAPINVPQRRLH